MRLTLIEIGNNVIRGIVFAIVIGLIAWLLLWPREPAPMPNPVVPTSTPIPTLISTPTLPATATSMPTNTSTATLSPSPTKMTPTSTRLIDKPTSTPTPTPVPVATFETYVIIKNDTLWDISGRKCIKPINWPLVWQFNRGVIGPNPHLIFPDTLLFIPPPWMCRSVLYDR